MIRKNKRRIDPRYFLHEKLNLMQEEAETDEKRTVIPVSSRYDPSKTKTGEYELFTPDYMDQLPNPPAVTKPTTPKPPDVPKYKDMPGYGKVRILPKVDWKDLPGRGDKESHDALDLRMLDFELSGEKQPFEGLNRAGVKKMNDKLRGWINEKGVDGAIGAAQDYIHNIGAKPEAAGDTAARKNYLQHLIGVLSPIAKKRTAADLKQGFMPTEKLRARKRFYEVPEYAKDTTHYRKPDGTIIAAEDVTAALPVEDWEAISKETDQEARIRLAGEYLDAVKTQFAKRGEEVPAGFDQELAGMSTAAIIRGINEVDPIHAEEGAWAISLEGDQTRKGKRLRKQQESHALSTGEGPKGNKARVKFTTTTEEVPTMNAERYKLTGGKQGIKGQTEKITKRTAQVFFQGEPGYNDAEPIEPGDPRFQRGTLLDPAFPGGKPASPMIVGPKGTEGRRLRVGAKGAGLEADVYLQGIADMGSVAELSNADDPAAALDDFVTKAATARSLKGTDEANKLHLGKLSFETATEGGVGSLVSLAYGLYDARSPEEREAGTPPKWKKDPNAKTSKTAELLLKGMYNKYQDLQKESVRLNGLAAKSREKLNGAKTLYADAQRDGGNPETIKAAKQALNRVQKIYNKWAQKSRVTNNSVAKFRPIMSPYGHARAHLSGEERPKSAEEEAAARQLTRDEAALKAAKARRAAEAAEAAEAAKAAEAAAKRAMPAVELQESLDRNKNKAFKIRIKRRKK